jgi:hypothetical protein
MKAAFHFGCAVLPAVVSYVDVPQVVCTPVMPWDTISTLFNMKVALQPLSPSRPTEIREQFSVGKCELQRHFLEVGDGAARLLCG